MTTSGRRYPYERRSLERRMKIEPRQPQHAFGESWAPARFIHDPIGDEIIGSLQTSCEEVVHGHLHRGRPIRAHKRAVAIEVTSDDHENIDTVRPNELSHRLVIHPIHRA